ncbi:flagellar biosynthetic protein FliR [uncultured Enterovirga sp.]|uniref:flagellar biosynthetic protein FliR n=1 Tax=uncultured Enterovirga sp. TaxID=2026352 RepID=UPI0035CC24C2
MTFAIPELTTVFLLAFARVGTLVMLLPGIGERSIPGRVRLAFALLLTLILLPTARSLLPAASSPSGLVGTLIGEIAVGLVLGLAARAVMAALQTAGTLVAQQLGLSYATTVDPSMGGQEAALSTFLTLLGVTLIFATDVHHIAIAGIADSYRLLPPVGIPAPGDAATLVLGSVGRGFALGAKIAAPFIAFAILFNLGLGILSRLMPQMQVFFIGLPLTILFGMLILVASLGLMMALFLEDLGRFLEGVGAL